MLGLAPAELNVMPVISFPPVLIDLHRLLAREVLPKSALRGHGGTLQELFALFVVTNLTVVQKRERVELAILESDAISAMHLEVRPVDLR